MVRKDRKWGNTNKSRGKIRRWSKDYKENVDDSWILANEDITETPWMELSIRQLDPSQIHEALQEGKLNQSALDEIDEVGIENAEIYEIEVEAGSNNYQYAYATRDDFEINDLFTAKGRDSRSSEFDYFVFEIWTPVSRGEA